MGSCFSTHTVRQAIGAADLERQIPQILAGYHAEYGDNAYSGTLATKSHVVVEANKIFESEQAAADYLDGKYQDKWSDTVGAVRFRVYPAVSSKKIDAFNAALRTIDQELWAQPRAIIDRVRAGKSKKRGCPHCGSAIAIAHVRSLACPACGEDYLTTDTDRRKKTALDAKKARITADIDAETAALRKKTGPATTHWIIGGRCPC